MDYTLDQTAPASTRPIVFVAIPVPIDTLMLLEQLATDDTPIENVASLLLAAAAREAHERAMERRSRCGHSTHC